MEEKPKLVGEKAKHCQGWMRMTNWILPSFYFSSQPISTMKRAVVTQLKGIAFLSSVFCKAQMNVFWQMSWCFLSIQWNNLQNILFYVSQNKVIQIWNNTTMSIFLFWRFFIFGLTILTFQSVPHIKLLYYLKWLRIWISIICIWTTLMMLFVIFGAHQPLVTINFNLD